MSKLIRVSNETHTELVKIGAKAETFDDVIQRLIKSDHKTEWFEKLTPRKGVVK